MSKCISDAKLAPGTVKNVINREVVEIIAQRVTKDPFVEVLDYELSWFSAERIGFLGSHKQLKITAWKKDAMHEEKLNLFVKAVPYESEQQAKFILKDGVFKAESNFFFKLAPKMLENYTGEKWLPECFYASEDVIVMEDLRFQGFKMFGKFFDESMVARRSSISTLARFHACSILAEAQLSRESGTSVTLKDRYHECFAEISFVQRGSALTWYLSGVDVAAAIAKKLGYDTEKLRKGFDRIYEMVKPSAKFRNAICHIDLWSNNYMADESLERSILLDFQLYRYAPLVLDILQLLHIGLPPTLRREHESELVRLYHLVLEETVRRDDKTELAKVPSLREITEGMGDLRMFGNIMACIYYQFAILDGSVLTEFTNSENYEDFVFGDRKKFILPYMRENTVYGKLMEDAVVEIMETCDRMF